MAFGPLFSFFLELQEIGCIVGSFLCFFVAENVEGLLVYDV